MISRIGKKLSRSLEEMTDESRMYGMKDVRDSAGLGGDGKSLTPAVTMDGRRGEQVTRTSWCYSSSHCRPNSAIACQTMHQPLPTTPAPATARVSSHLIFTLHMYIEYIHEKCTYFLPRRPPPRATVTLKTSVSKSVSG